MQGTASRAGRGLILGAFVRAQLHTQLHAPGSSGSRLRGAVGRGWGGLRRRALLPGTGEPRAGRARTEGPAGAQKP